MDVQVAVDHTGGVRAPAQTTCRELLFCMIPPIGVRGVEEVPDDEGDNV